MSEFLAVNRYSTGIGSYLVLFYISVYVLEGRLASKCDTRRDENKKDAIYN